MIRVVTNGRDWNECIFKNTVKLDLYVFPSDIAAQWEILAHWDLLDKFGPSKQKILLLRETTHTLWNRRRIRVTTADWHNTVGIPPSWQLLYFDTPVNSKFDKNHHTWKTKKEEPDQFVKIFLEAFSSKWAQQLKSGFGWLLEFFGEWIWTNIWIANCHFKILKI